MTETTWHPQEQRILDGLYNQDSPLEHFACSGCGRECADIKPTGDGYAEPWSTVRPDGSGCCSTFSNIKNPLEALKLAIGHYAILEQESIESGADSVKFFALVQDKLRKAWQRAEDGHIAARRRSA